MVTNEPITMKLFALLIGLVFAFASLTAGVDAYGIYGASSLPRPYGYQEQTNFYDNFNIAKQEQGFSNANRYLYDDKGDFFRNYQQFNQLNGATGFSNSYFQSFLEDSDIDLNDGYNFKKGPCVTEKIQANFRGKDNDFTITRDVCDNIEGTFYKDNSFSNSLNNAGQANAFDFGGQTYQNQLNQQDASSRTYTNQQSGSSSQNFLQKTLSATFGKGTWIVLN